MAKNMKKGKGGSEVSVDESQLRARHEELANKPRRYIHLLRYCCATDVFEQEISKYVDVQNNTLAPNLLLPIPANYKVEETIKEWTQENWGTTEDSFNVEICDTTLIFESTQAQLYPLIAKISSMIKGIELLYKVASDNLLDDASMINVNYYRGRLMNANHIQSPQAFACSLWRRDLFDLCLKRRMFPQAVYVEEVEASGTEDALEDASWVLSQEDN